MRLTESEARSLGITGAGTGKPSKRSKYGAVRCDVDGIKFASQKEARRYLELKALKRAGKIVHLECQPRFDLYVRNESMGARIRRAVAGRASTYDRVRIGFYRADFRYRNADTFALVVEDVKGGNATKTPLYRWKRKHVMAQYGIDIKEV